MGANGLARGWGYWGVAVWAAFAAPAQAQSLHADYTISLIGVPVGVADITATFSGEKYTMEVHARLSGVAALVADWRTSSTASGVLAAGRVSPSTNATTSSTKEMTRTIRMALQSNAVQAVDITPAFEMKPDVVPVTPKDEQGVVDPVGALLMPAAVGPDVDAAAACERTLPVFDGATRFDVALSYVGERKVKAKGYSGPVAICAMRYTPLAGFRRERANTKFWTENKDMEVWLAPIGALHALVPFRASIRTPVGTAVMEATEFRVDK